MTIKVSRRKAIFSEIGKYCHHSGENDYIEVTEWANDEGFDINISRRKSEEKFSLTYGEVDLLTVLMNWRGDEEQGE